jgi:hypothetical protein
MNSNFDDFLANYGRKSFFWGLNLEDSSPRVSSFLCFWTERFLSSVLELHCTNTLQFLFLKAAQIMVVKRILVTGANKGIGLAICASLISRYSDTFVLLGSRDAERGARAVSDLMGKFPDAQGRVEPLLIDVASDDSVQRAAKEVEAKFGCPSLSCVINNAGIYPSAGSGLAEALNVNVRGPCRVTNAFLPLLDPEYGRIVNVSAPYIFFLCHFRANLN